MKNKRFSPVIKTVLFVLIILVMHLLQFTVIPYTGLSFPILLMLPMGIALSMSEKEFSAVLYGIFIGALWDLSSPVTDGLWTLLFPILFCVTGLLTHYTLRNTLLTAIIFTTVSTVLYLGIVSLYLLDGVSTDMLSSLFTRHWLPTAIAAIAFSVPEYYAVKKLSKFFNHDKVTF